MKTFSAKPHEVKQRLVRGRRDGLGPWSFASELRCRLRGKHKAIYTPHVDTGDYIVVVNVEKLRVTGNRPGQSTIVTPVTRAVSTKPTSPSCSSVPRSRGLRRPSGACCPRARLGYAMLKKMKCYAGAEHPHAAQQPKVLAI